jgi:hypothetical protein
MKTYNQKKHDNRLRNQLNLENIPWKYVNFNNS